MKERLSDAPSREDTDLPDPLLAESSTEAVHGKRPNPEIANNAVNRQLANVTAAAALRAKPQERSQLRVTTEAAFPFDVARTLDDVRQVLAQVAAFAHAKADLFHQAPPTEDREARHRREILAHLAQAIAEAIEDALEASDQLAAGLVTRSADADI